MDQTTPLSQAESQKLESLKALKMFRNSAEVENFYRFIHENGLRHEAKMVFEKICATFAKKRKKRKKRKKKIQ